MATPKQPDKSQNKISPLSDADLDQAQANLEHALRGLDEGGEVGLQKALDDIYPETERIREPIPGLPGSYSWINRKKEHRKP
jgi:hypothetical protein